MNRRLTWLILLAVSVATAQQIPAELVGKWVIKRQLATTTISCWGNKEANAILGTEIEYLPHSFRWKDTVVKDPAVEVVITGADQFADENSGGGTQGSKVSFRQLGIRKAETEQVTIKHAPAEITGATIEIPGDRVLFKNHNTIVLSVCNVYFEARQLPSVINNGNRH